MTRKVREFIWSVQSRLWRECQGTELIELAIALPILLVMAVGIGQFGGVLNLKQVVNNAAREGARSAANEFSDAGTLGNCGSGSCIAAVAETVSNYLKDANVDPQCAFSTTGSSSGTFTWTFTSSGGGTCSLASLTVAQGVPVVIGSTTVKSSHVTLTYPSPYSLGGILKLLGANVTMPTSITSDATMPSIN